MALWWAATRAGWRGGTLTPGRDGLVLDGWQADARRHLRQPPQPPDRQRMAVELFAGGGGLALGLEAAGWDHMGLFELEPRAVATLRRNRPQWPTLQADLNEVDWTGWRSPGLLCGGPPCQPYSEAGLGKGAADERDGWPATLRAVEALRPTWCAFENVPSTDSRAAVARVLVELARWYPWTAAWELCAADYGVPQARTRLFVLAGPRGVVPPARTHAPDGGGGLFPLERWVSVRQALQLGEHATGIRRGHGYLPDRVADLDAPSSTLTTQSFGVGTDLRINDTGELTDRERATIEATPRDVYGRSVTRPPEGWKWQGANDGLRRPTEAELQILAGFPPGWVFAGPSTARSKQRGNAVPPRLGEVVGRAIATAAGWGR